MKYISLTKSIGLAMLASCWAAATAQAEESSPLGGQPTPVLNAASTNYLLRANDVIHIRVYREEDLETRVRLARDGTINFPLIGSFQIGGYTTDQAAAVIRDLLGRDYLVNPQITISIVEFAKRSFTVLGEINRPGTYEMPADQSIHLLQAVSMAGGYTRLAAPGKITVQRYDGDKKTIHNLDGRSMAKDTKTKVFELMPDDIITIGESIF